MKVYRCKVRLAGNVANEVVRENVTAAEIKLLQHIHGGEDAVIEITETGEKKNFPHEAERSRLRHEYQSVIYKTEPGKMDPIMELFGPEHLPLPHEIKARVPETAPVEQVAGLLD